MQITMAVERKVVIGDDVALNAVLQMPGYGALAQIFLQEIEKDEQSLWDGRAQAAAFLAYFAPENASILWSYDKSTCDYEVKWRKQGWVPEEMKGRGELINAVETLFSMPYIAENGEMKERPYYKALRDIVTPELILTYMDRYIKGRVTKIEKQIAEGPKHEATPDPALEIDRLLREAGLSGPSLEMPS